MRPFPKIQKLVLFHLLMTVALAILGGFWGLLRPPKGLLRKNEFRDDLICYKHKFLLLHIYCFLNLSIWYPVFREICALITKMEDSMRQLGLLPIETLSPRVQYELLFQHLPCLSLRENDRGRPALPKDAFLRAFIYKALRRLKTLRDLVFEFHNNPVIYQAVGFNPYVTPPSLQRFSQFIRNTPHSALQEVRIQLVHLLLQEGVVSAKHLVMDSCPILANVRENNLKTAVSNRFEKSRRAKGDHDARVGVMIHFPQPFKREIRYFWGYRNHVMADAEEELPLWEVTHPADSSEIHQAIPMLQRANQSFSLNVEIVGGDAIYDTEKILRFIIKELEAKAVIPRNPRAESNTPYTIKGNELYCQADLPMHRKGKMTEKKSGITYLQYCCPIHFGKQKQSHLLCPAAHPKFIRQKGCNALIRLTPSIREQIDYGSQAFKALQRKRTSVERVFARLLRIAMQDPPVIGIDAIRNYCTIAHITVLLVALAAKRSGHPNKTRFVRSFVPDILTRAQNRFS